MTHPYHKELQIATLAIKRASILTKHLSDSIQQLKNSNSTITKDDKSPVTIGDFASQAIINHAIKINFPNDEIVGEEDSKDLQSNSNLSKQILDLISQIQFETKQFDSKIGKLDSIEQIYSSIDFGDSKGGSKGRFWALDPIDGTKGFLRGDQFAVCLALIEDGEVVLGVIGCPNLNEIIISNEEQIGEKGGLYSSIKGVGSYYTKLFKSDFIELDQQKRLKMSSNSNPNDIKVVEGVEKGHSSHSNQSKIKSILGITQKNQSINLDSQVKYCVLANGQADLYLRLPINNEYKEKIWDHAAGNILVTESGGIVSDIYGNKLNFGNGRLLNSKGVIASNKEIFEKVISAIEQVI